jgi:hypothetical protein
MKQGRKDQRRKQTVDVEHDGYGYGGVVDGWRNEEGTIELRDEDRVLWW